MDCMTLFDLFAMRTDMSVFSFTSAKFDTALISNFPSVSVLAKVLLGMSKSCAKESAYQTNKGRDGQTDSVC